MQYIPQEGTISHGTLRYVDLIPVFADEIAKFNPEHDVLTDEVIRIARESDDEVSMGYEVRRRYNADPHEIVMDLVDEMDDVLNNFGVQHNLRFGAHEGDGSDFGWWALENQE